MSKNLQEQYAQTPLFGGNAGAVEALYQQYINDPASVAPAWRDYFDALDDANTELAHSEIRHRLRQAARNGGSSAAASIVARAAAVADGEKQAAVSRLIQVYATRSPDRGHRSARPDASGRCPGCSSCDYFGLSDADLDTEFYTGSLAGTGNRRMKLRDIIAQLRQIYCGTIGAEFAHVSRSSERLWLQDRFQEGRGQTSLRRRGPAQDPAPPDRRRGLERYLHTQYPARSASRSKAATA